MARVERDQLRRHGPECSAHDCPQMSWQSADMSGMRTELLLAKKDKFCACDSDGVEQQTAGNTER